MEIDNSRGNITEKIIDGKAIAQEIRRNLTITPGQNPHLAVVLVGQNPASLVYIRNKENACREVGIDFSLVNLPTETTEATLLAEIHRLNSDPTITGILVQQPLPSHINTHHAVLAIDPTKDVDCLHPTNLGLVATGHGKFAPCTPGGIITMLERVTDLAGKDVVIVGRSNIVGKPLGLMLLGKNATVTTCHSHSKNLQDITRRADILIVAIGHANFITPQHVKPGAIVIDVGMNRLPDGQLCGDVDFAAVAPIASHITPVPGGVGPMTIATLLQNITKS